MSILLKQVKIICPTSSFNNKLVDVLIEGGKIVDIKKNITESSNLKLVTGKNLTLSIGWFDMLTTSGEPGFEHKETLNSLVKTAASGGFTGIAVHSNNHPQFSNKAQIEYVLNNTKNKIINVYPIGTITVNSNGKELSEMFDMKLSGSVAFSDYKHPIKDAGSVYRALQYANNINSLIQLHCNDESLSQGGQMNEGENSTKLGLKGMPAFAEEIMLARNISILEETGGKLHINTISTKGSIELIKKAKANGLNITCGVSAINLVLDDNELIEFNSNLKLNPPLRTKKDVAALKNAVESEIIDVIVSDHCPHDIESKELEFDLAEFGAIQLQTAIPNLLEKYKEKDLTKVIDALTINPRKILGIEIPTIEINSDANLTIFSQDESFDFDKKYNSSLSNNSHLLNTNIQSKVIGVINGTKSYFNP
jgi:dihydroorotase